MLKKNKLTWWIVLLAGIVLVNFIASKLHARFDLTEDRRYSLTPATKDLARQLKEDLEIDVFLKGDFPAEFRKLANSTQEFLSILKESNPSHIHYRFIDPQDEIEPGKRWGDTLTGMGASPINLSVQVKSGEENKIVFPYALIRQGERTGLVNLFENMKRNISVMEMNNAEAMLEYQFAHAIDRMVHPERPIVAYAMGNGEPATAETFDLRQTLSGNYRFVTFDLTRQPGIPDTIKALVVVKPANQFSDAEKLKIDQYIMRGGKLLWFLDNLNAEQDSLNFTDHLIAYDRNLNLQDMLFTYGVRLNPDLIMDIQSDFLPFAVGGDQSKPQYEFIHWNYYPLFESKNNHIINKKLGLVAGRFVNSVDTVEAVGISKTFLLQSSSSSRTISTPAAISPNENRNAPDPSIFKQKDIPAAVLLEGKFFSLYRGRVTAAQRDSLQQFGGFHEESAAPNKMIVVADGDMVLNDFSSKQGPLPMGLNLFTVGSQYEYQFANREFLLNCMEYLVSNSGIISTRNKEIVLRQLDTKKVEAEKSKWQLINIVLPIILVILFGFIYQQVRKYRYVR
jgi:ABC-2 type transport system permease protein